MDDKIYNDEFEDHYDDESGQKDESNEVVATVSGWGLSLAMHAIVFLLLAFVVIANRLLEDPVPVVAAYVEPAPPPPEHKREEMFEDKKITIPEDEVVPEPVVDDLDVPSKIRKRKIQRSRMLASPKVAKRRCLPLKLADLVPLWPLAQIALPQGPWQP